MKKMLLALVAILLSSFIVACGGNGGGNPAGVPMPSLENPTGTTSDATPKALQVSPSNFNLGGLGASNMLNIFDIPTSPGTLAITLNWSFEDSTLGVYLLSQPGCHQTPSGGWTTSSIKEISDGTCPTLIGSMTSVSSLTKTIEITRPSSPGKAYLYIMNERKTGGESGHVEVIYTQKP